VSIEAMVPFGLESTPVPAGMQDEWRRLGALSDVELERELALAAEATAKNFLRLALILRQKEERGHDTASLKLGMVQYLRKIAYGQLLPEAMARFGMYPKLLRFVSLLPLPDQCRLIEQEVAIGVIGENGRVSHRMKDARLLTLHEMRQVFATDHVRSPAEQVSWRRSLDDSRATPAQAVRHEPPSYTVAKGHLIVNRPTTLSRRDLQNILRSMTR
jgi:hypothetical protein